MRLCASQICKTPQTHCGKLYVTCVNYSLQMQHPIQMKPADSEKRNGELHLYDKSLSAGIHYIFFRYIHQNVK